MSLPFSQVQTQTNSSNSNAATLTLALASNTTNGNTIFVVFASSSQSFAHVTSITDTSGNTYSAINTGTNTGSGELWYAKNINAGTTPTITINIGTGTGNSVAAVAAEYGGFNRSPLDVHATSTGTSTTMNSSTTSVTGQTNELILVWGSAQASLTPTVGAGFGNLVFKNDGTAVTAALQDKTVTSTGAQTGSITIASNAWIGGIATFMTSYTPSRSIRPHPFSPGIAR